MTLLFSFVILAIVLWQYKREKNIINMTTLLAGPYLFIFIINNYVFTRMGFYPISTQVMGMITASIAVFFLGTCVVSTKGIPELHETDNTIRFEEYRIESMTKIVLLIGIIGALKFIRLYLTGQFSATNFDNTEGVMGNGTVGHLLLLSYSIVPIVFLYWLENRKKVMCLISVLLIVAVTFTTFVKYNVIGVVFNLFLFTMLYKKSLFKKGILILFSVVVALFVGNYLLGFMARGLNVSSSFYLEHFWTYISGSAIYDNYIFTPGLNSDITIGYKLLTFIFAFPNMFITTIFGVEPLFPHVQKSFLAVGAGYGVTSNVTDAFGYLYPSKGDAFDILVYFVVLFVIAIIVSYIYIRSKRLSKQKHFNVFISNLITYFVFFSFFGTFYINPAPWEICIYSLIVPPLFLKATNLRRGIIRL